MGSDGFCDQGSCVWPPELVHMTLMLKMSVNALNYDQSLI